LPRHILSAILCVSEAEHQSERRDGKEDPHSEEADHLTGIC
jgi:hypothetical protein